MRGRDDLEMNGMICSWKFYNLFVAYLLLFLYNKGKETDCFQPFTM